MECCTDRHHPEASPQSIKTNQKALRGLSLYRVARKQVDPLQWLHQ